MNSIWDCNRKFSHSLLVKKEMNEQKSKKLNLFMYLSSLFIIGTLILHFAPRSSAPHRWDDEELTREMKLIVEEWKKKKKKMSFEVFHKIVLDSSESKA